jgi:hypothetical protein
MLASKAPQMTPNERGMVRTRNTVLKGKFYDATK